MEVLKRLTDLNKVVFKLKITGPITNHMTEKVIKSLKGNILYNPVALAVVVNSMGGSATQSNLIRSEIEAYAAKAKIPVYCFAEDFATAGSYLILSSGTKIYCSEASLMGSIGARFNFFDLKDAAENYGIKRRTWSTSPKDIDVRLDPLTPLSEDSKNWANGILEQSTTQLQKAIEKTRGSKLVKEKAFTGETFTGKQAEEVGLVDGLGHCDEVMNQLFPQRKVVEIGNRFRRF